jgi:hypothetical protein
MGRDRDIDDPFLFAAEIEQVKKLKRMAFEKTAEHPSSNVLNLLYVHQNKFEAVVNFTVKSPVNNGDWYVKGLNLHNATLPFFKTESGHFESGSIEFESYDEMNAIESHRPMVR